MKDRLAKSVFWIGWAKGALQIVAFLTTILIARLLAPRDYGLIALTGMWVGSLALLAEMGLSAAIVQFRDLDERELNACFWLSLGVSLAGYGLLYALAPLIEQWFSTPMLADVLRVLSLTLPLTGLRIVPDSLLRKAIAFDKVSQVEILAACVGLPVQVGLAIAGAGVWALVAGMLTVQVFQAVATFAFVDWRPGLKVGSRRSKEMMSYSLSALGGRLCWGIYDQMDVFILGKMSGEVLVGVYSMAKQLAMLPVHKVSGVVNQLAAPVMAELQRDIAQMRSALLRQVRLVASLTTPLCAGLALVADDFIHVVLTDKWMPVVPILRLLCLFAMWHSVTIMLPPVLFARYRAGFMFRWNAALLVTMSFAFWAGAAWKGALGIAFAWITVYPVITLVKVRRVMKELDLTWRIIATTLRPILVATVLMCCSVGLLRYLIPAPTSLPEEILRLAGTCAIGFLTYLAAILWQGKLLVAEFTEVFWWLLKGFRPAPASK